MNDSHIETLEQVRQFLDGAAVMKITIPSKTECYRWIRGVLVRFQYRTLGKADKGLIRRYLQQISGYSRAQIARLIKQYQKTGRIQRRQRTVKGFTSKYTWEDIRLLAQFDELHGTLSGPATKKLCERAWQVFKQRQYPASCRNLGLAPIQPEAVDTLLSATGDGRQNSVGTEQHRRTTKAQAPRPSRLYPC